MSLPMKTPRLRLRLVEYTAEERFTADGFEAFRRRLTEAAGAIGYDLKGTALQLRGIYSDLSGLHVGGPKGDERYFWLGQTLQSQCSSVNAADEDPSATLSYFPEYDLHLAVAEAGGPRAYAYSFEGAWMMCQVNLLWGLELSRFCDEAIGEMLDEIHREREEETGEYQVRIPKKYERN
jgi:hypothetical protein